MSRGNRRMCDKRGRRAVTTWPVRATETGVGETREAAEHHEVQRHEGGDPDQLAEFIVVGLDPYVGQRQQRNAQADQAQLQYEHLSTFSR